MFPMLRNKALPAKAQRIFFLAYCVRHTMGIVLFGWVCVAGSQIGNPAYFYLLLAGLAVYAVSALYNGKKMWTRYRLQLAEEVAARESAGVMQPEEAA